MPLIMSSKEGFATLWGIMKNFETKFVTEALGGPCLKSPEGDSL